MAQQYAPVPGYVDPNTEMIAKMIESLGQTISTGVRQTIQMKKDEKSLQMESFGVLEKLKSLPPEFRKILANDPNTSKRLLELMDPHLFSKHNDKKEGAKPTNEDLQKFAEPTALETAQLSEAQNKAMSEGLKAKMETMKVGLAEGSIKATPMNLLMAGDLKDPIAAALFSLVDTSTLKDIAEAQHKMGPLWEKNQTIDQFKWFMEQGMQSGQALFNAKAVVEGNWSKVDPKFRGKVEQQLALDAMAAQTNRMNVQNTISNSKANLSVELARDAGLTLQQAQQAVEDLRAGKTPSIDTTMFEHLKMLDAMQKKQEIEKNTLTILKDKSGMAAIDSALRGLLDVAKGEASGFFSTGASKKTVDQIQLLKDELASRIGKLYGIDTPQDPTWGETISSAAGSVLDTIKATGAYSADMIDDLHKAIAGPAGSVIPPGVTRGGVLGPTVPKRTFTPEEEATVKGIVSSIGNALSDESVPAAQKEALRKYYEDELKPIINDPSRFLEIFNGFGKGTQ